MLLLPQEKDKKEKQKGDDGFFRLALGEDYQNVLDLHQTGQYLELCGKLSVLKILLSRWKSEDKKVVLPPPHTNSLIEFWRFLGINLGFALFKIYSNARLARIFPQKGRIWILPA